MLTRASGHADAALPDNADGSSAAIRAAGHPAVAAARTLTDRVRTVAVEHKRNDLATMLHTEVSGWERAETVVVVAGAQKRGKSSLINTLMNRPGLVPVDDDIATSTHISLRYGDQLAVTARTFDGHELSIALQQLADYASILGDPNCRRDVSSVDIALAHPLLRGVRLVDTPGVDSLTLGHKHATMAALTTADVLLFTLSGRDEPVQRHELEFLLEACRRVSQIAFILTKIDDAPYWGDLLVDNRQRLARFLDQQDPDTVSDHDRTRLMNAVWLPVSSRMADAAAASRARGETTRADQLRARSRMGEVETFIRRTHRDRDRVNAQRALTPITTVIDELISAQRDAHSAASDSSYRQRLADLDRQRKATIERSHQWKAHRPRLQFLNADAGNIVKRYLERLRHEYEADLHTNKPRSNSQIQQIAEQLPASLHRSLAAAWQDIVAEAYQRTRVDLIDCLQCINIDDIDNVDNVDVTLGDLRLPEDIGAGSSREIHDKPFNMVEDVVPSLGVFSTLIIVGSQIALGPIVPFVLAPAVAAAVIVKRWNHQVATRGLKELTALVTDSIADANRTMTLTLQKAIAEQRARVETVINTRLDEERADLDRRIAAVKATAQQNEQARRQAASHAQQRLNVLTALKAEANELRQHLQSQRPADPTRH